jgi:hypothetical protein
MNDEMTFHEAVSHITTMVDALEKSGLFQAAGFMLGVASEAACWSYINKQALFSEQERLIAPDDWESYE